VNQIEIIFGELECKNAGRTTSRAGRRVTVEYYFRYVNTRSEKSVVETRAA